MARIAQYGIVPLLSALVLFAAGCSSAPPAPDEPAVFYPAPPDPPRIQFLRTVSVADDIEEGRSSLDSLLFGEETLQKSVLAPYGCAVWEGIVYVCDIQQGVILKLDFEEGLLDYIRDEGRGKLQKPTNLEFGEDGSLYVTDIGRRQIVVFGPDQKYSGEFGPFAEDSRLVDLALTDDRIYAVDAGSKLVRALDRASGEELFTFGQSEEVGQSMLAPTNITIDDAGLIYVVDTVDCRLFTYDSDGQFVKHIGSSGDTVGQFARPKGVAYSEEKLFVIDAAFENCQVLTLEGEPLMFFGGSGVGPGDLYLPAGVWIGTEGLELFEDELEDDFEAEQLIIITNLYGPRKVNFYALGKDRNFNYDETPAASE